MTEQIIQTGRLSADALAAQKRRNAWLALALVGFVILVGITTAIRIQATDFSKNEGFYFSGSLEQETRTPPPELAPPEGD